MIPRYEYQTVNTSHYGSVADAANVWAAQGWRSVSVIGSPGPGYADTLLIERELPPSFIVMRDNPPTKKQRQWWNPKSW